MLYVECYDMVNVWETCKYEYLEIIIYPWHMNSIHGIF